MLAATLDPDGRRVVLKEEDWSHIKLRHPDMSASLREIMATVREPDRQMPDRSDRATTRYFGERDAQLPWLQVVVHYEGGEGWIVTAFARRSLPRS